MSKAAERVSYTYDLPKELIADRPVEPRDACRLLVVKRESGELRDCLFADLAGELYPSDLLVLNDTKVIPARVFGELEGSRVEILMVSRDIDGNWTCLGRPLKRFREGSQIEISGGISAKVLRRISDVEVLISFSGSSDNALSAGVMPIPPYIRKGQADSRDTSDYQTCFAKNAGSIAAPTASLHFTQRCFESLHQRGISEVYLTLHLSAYSFIEPDLQPLYQNGKKESGQIPASTWKQIQLTKSGAGRVVAVGTSCVRAIENAASDPKFVPGNDFSTELFIFPPYEFQVCDALLTNFHQPGSSHLNLVEALIGKKLLGEVYEHALKQGYRFLSYGDAMLIC